MTVLTESPTGAAAGRMSLRDMVARPLLLVSAIVVVVVSTAVGLADVIAPYGPLAQDLAHALEGPSAEHPLGTDALGRDILSRLLHGGRPALLGVVVAVSVFASVGLVLGLLAGYLRGWVDRVTSAILDVMMSVPSIVVILAVLAIFSQNVTAAMFVLGLLASASLARIVRSACLALREELYVVAATVSGIGPWRIMFRHVLPALTGPLFVQSALFAGIALAVQTGLGFLGLATPAPHPSWGGMVGEAAVVLHSHGFFLFVAGGIIAIMTIAFGLIGDGARDLDSDSKGRAGGRRPLRLAVGSAASDLERDPELLLQVDGLAVAFTAPDGRAVEAVRGIDFGVRRGEIFGLVGESGSGKTVTAHALIGLLAANGAVTDGRAWLGGDDLASLPRRDFERRIRGRRIGLVSQEPMAALDPLFTIGAQLGEVVAAIGRPTSLAVRQRVIGLLESVQLRSPESLLDRYPHELSGGMLQRVVIAMAIAGSPDLLIADEPTTALDVTVQAGILELLRELRDTRGMAIILVTHDLAVVADVCDRAMVMRDGRVVETAAVDDLFYRPREQYTKTLISKTPSIVEAAS